MQIQSTGAYSACQKQTSTVNNAVNSAASAASFADMIAAHQTGSAIPAAQSKSAAQSVNGATAVFDTDQGSKSLNIDEYFSPSTQTNGLGFSLPPLLLPNQKNIDALTHHISEIFPQFLAQNNIPSAPSPISYDSEGKIQLPEGYAYASEFKQALEKNPALAKELSTVNALTSHWVEMKKLIPFQQAYAAAVTVEQTEAVVAQYSYLFSSNHHYDVITLQFSADGRLTLTDDGKTLS